MADNTQIIKRSYKAFLENDFDTLLELYHPESVWTFTNWEDFVEKQVYEGHEGVREVLQMMQGDIGIIRNSFAEIVELDENRLFIEGRTTMRGATSGIEIEMPPFGQIIEFRDGLIVRVDNYSDVETCRSAAGLPASP